ncbi:MAG: flagellar basal body rod protein FlgB [Cellvibrionaceae bacterium]|nr:flagellar basal body rod protein FlgB [Cellvibrionaceae bacterium]|tara:strand:- start:943 stop:1335 length:393 start_codon:yes stop_codon:yes gene_type:complete
MGINFERALGIHEPALKFRSQRAAVLASNLANTDTPNFKARDVSFQSVLQEQMSKQVNLNLTSQGHLEAPSAVRGPNLFYRTPQQSSIDGNTVEEQVEHAETMKNSLDFQFSFLRLNGGFKGLMKAIKGE